MKIIFILAVLFSTSAFAQTQNCIQTYGLRGLGRPTATTLTVQSGAFRYQLNVAYCMTLQNALKLSFDTPNGSPVCVGNNVLVLDDYSNRVIQSCRILTILKI